jgi:hypothetical protein
MVLRGSPAAAFAAFRRQLALLRVISKYQNNG